VHDATDLHAAVADLRASLARIGDLVTVMRELVGGRRPALGLVCLSEVVQRVVHWGEHDALKGVELEVVLDEPVIALAHPRLLEQSLMNLMSNAAIAARGSMTPAVRLHVYRTRERAVVSVRDNGPGIPAELREQIFEPFFTTRRGGSGMGLGLALCREYVRQMSGQISLWSAQDGGTCFRIHLPLAT
jgi:signal transduction histidine kinase